MSFLKKVNVVRRKIMRGLAGNIGKAGSAVSADKIKTAEIKTILINRPNHRLGNLLMLTPIIQELSKNYPNCKIDLFIRGGLAPILFKNYQNVNDIIPLPKKPFKELVKYIKVWTKIKNKKYDLVINIDAVSSSGRIATKVARAKYKFFGNENEAALQKYSDARHMAKKPVYLLRENILLPVSSNSFSPIPSLNIQLTDVELSHGKEVLLKYFDNGKPSISLFTYATGAKCYSKEWWQNFYEALSKSFPQYNFLEILPAENISQLNFSIPSFHSMDVREICSVIANTTLFIGADSGMMHLGAAAGIPAIGLFSITDMKMYEPYGNGSCGINTDETDTTASMKIIANLLSQ
ncbi:MAG TPA: glycosyltransferase family 9 protein [Ferruginibacter sp.]|nr:glycosyltransferase family 9 protein [Ferruginibacter sp.]HRE64658.1 glycosyltransferase family 9 protein [Ferruginibacter sp.]